MPMKAKLIKTGRLFLSFLIVATMFFPTVLAEPINASAITTESVAQESSASANIPRIRYYVPYDSWQRDFSMTETDDYYHCTIPSLNAQVAIYSRNQNDLSELYYSGLDVPDTKNINVEFESIEGKTYKNVKIISPESASNELDIRIEKTTGIVYGVSGDVSEPIYSDIIQINAKTSTDDSFKTYDMNSGESRFYTYTFNATTLEMDFIYQSASVTSQLNYKSTDSNNKGINLYKTEDANTYTAEIIDTQNCNQIKISIDKYTGSVYAEAIKSDITPENNKTYYLEGRFVCKDFDENNVSVNDSEWSDTSTNLVLTETDTKGLYKYVTSSTAAELTATNGAPYYFFVREGTKYPKSASGSYYAPKTNQSLSATKPGEKKSVAIGSSSGGGLYFNDKTNNSGKVTIWFDNTNPETPSIYYTVRYENFNSKSMYSLNGTDFVDLDKSVVSIVPSDNIELPNGTTVTAVPTLSENGKEYDFIGWTTENSTGEFADSNLSETTFYPTADNETITALYKLVYTISCESAEHGQVSVSNDKVAVGESFTIDFTPDDGYTLASLLINGEEKINDTLGRTQYVDTMPENPVTVKAVFEKKNDVYFYAAVPTKWTEAHKYINVIADGEKIEAVEVFENLPLYNLNSTTKVVNGSTFYVNLFKVEQHSKLLIGNPENADGTVDKNCYGHKVLSGELQPGACYYYYSAGSGNNFKDIISAMNVKSVTCLTEDPTKDEPVQLAVVVEDCNGKTAGQESYTLEYDVKDPSGNSYTVTDNKFTPTISGLYTVAVWAAYGDAKSNIAECKVNVKGDEPINTELTVEFKYYDRDPQNQMEISNSETTLAVNQSISEDGIEKTLLNAYTSVEDKLKKNMNIMSEYYFYISQSKAIEGIKAQKNYHALKTDSNGEIIRDSYGIAQYKTYGESYSESDLKYHTDNYGNIGNSEAWVTYYSGDQVIDEKSAYENPNSVTRVVIYGFNTPRIYHVGMSFVNDDNTVSVTSIHEQNDLYIAENSVFDVYDVFYNMSLASGTDYSSGGYLSHFAISEYYGNTEMPTAVASIKSDNGNKYIFDGWYDNSNGSWVKVSSDLNFTSRITNDINLTAVYKNETAVSKTPTVTVTKSDTEKYRENDIDKVRINTIINVFDCENIQNTAIIYVRLKATENSDWENNYESIDYDSLKESIVSVLNNNDIITGRKISVVTIGNVDKAQIIADCYEVVSDESLSDVQEFKIVLNNKNRVQFANSFTAQSANDNGANSAILTFAAVNNGSEWIISDNYIPYINTGK